MLYVSLQVQKFQIVNGEPNLNVQDVSHYNSCKKIDLLISAKKQDHIATRCGTKSQETSIEHLAHIEEVMKNV